MVNHIQDVLDAAYRRYAMRETVPRVGIPGPFPSSFMPSAWHGASIMSRMLSIGVCN